MASSGRWALLVLAATLLAGRAAAQTAINDTIVTTDGTLRGVTITEMTLAQVRYTKGGRGDRVAADKVVAIAWHEPPESFALAEDEERKGDWDNAANHYLQTAATPELRQPLVLEAKFRGARAMLSASTGDAAKAQAAAAALQSYLDAAPEGFRVPAARLLLARALRLQGQAQEAEQALTAFRDAALRNGWGLAWEARARVEAALALVAQRKFGEARAAYASAVAAIEAARGSAAVDAELHDLRIESIVGEGETFVAERDYEQALAYFRRFTAAPPAGASTALQAAALAGEGEALYLQAEASGDAAMLRTALTVLARANILDPLSGATTAKALYYSGRTLLALGPDREQGAAERARAYFDTVVRYHADTGWAGPARAEVGK